MRNITLLIKPASSLCNLRCRYCFYADIADIREVSSFGVMPRETAHLLIDRTFAAIDPDGSIQFIFQGGEPTMAGLSFFQDFTAYVNAHRPLTVQISYCIQTNGMVLDERWAELFQKNHFLVGVSVDGYPELHDFNRVDPKHEGTYHRVTRGIAILQKYHVDVNLLCVVTAQCARHPQKVYASMKKLHVPFLQYIPCLDPLDAKRGSMTYSLTPELYGKFLCGLFDLWYQDWVSGNYTSIRLFEDHVQLAMGLPASTCTSSGSCGSYFVVESNGGVYPCDFFVLDQYYMGNIKDHTLPELAATRQARGFLQESAVRPDECAHCRWKPLCNGGCRRDWTTANQKNHNYYCSSFQTYFAHAEQRLIYMARCEAQRRMQR